MTRPAYQLKLNLSQTEVPTDVRRRIIVCVTSVEPIVDWRVVPKDKRRLTSAENERAAEVWIDIGCNH